MNLKDKVAVLAFDWQSFADVKDSLEKLGSWFHQIPDERFLTVLVTSSMTPRELFRAISETWGKYWTEEKWLSEKLQYQSWVNELLAQEARLKYFFGDKVNRKLVVSRPLECISLVQFARDPSFIGAYIRSSDISLAFMDLAFLFALPGLLDLDPPMIYHFSINFFHANDRKFGDTPLELTWRDLILLKG